MGKGPQDIHRAVQDYQVFDYKQLCEEQNYAHDIFCVRVWKFYKKKKLGHPGIVMSWHFNAGEDDILPLMGI